jgi:hypothetical protein
VSRTDLSLAELDAAGGRVHWLLELTIAGRVLRFTDGGEELVVVDVAGDETVWLPGLGDLVVQLEGDAADATVAIAPGEVDWAEMAAVGHDLHGTGRLLRWAEGQVLEAARQLVSGWVMSPAWGGEGEPFGCSISRPKWSNASPVPEASRSISSTTWPSATGITEGTAQGRAYPVIIGAPSRALPSGRIAGGSPAPIASLGTSATTVRDSTIIAADGEIVATAATLLWASDEEGEVSDVVDLVSAVDELGQRVTVVDLSTVENVLPESGGDYRIHWHAGGGVPSLTDPTVAISGAGEVIEYLLRRSGVVVDVGRQRAAGLDAYRIDAAISASANAEQWVQEHLGETIGLFRGEGARGVWYQPWPVLGDVREPTAGVELVEDAPEVDGGLVVIRTSAVSCSSVGDVANTITVEYALSDDKPTRRLVVSGTDADGALVARVCAWSRARYGSRSMRLQLAAVYDDATATRIALRAAAARALPRVSFDIEGDVELEALLRVGDVVAYTSAALRWTRRLCVVRSLELGRTTVAARLEVIEDPSDRRVA